MNQLHQFRQQPPAPLARRPIKVPTASATKLSNGLSIVVIEDRRLPLISYRLAFRTGDAHDPPRFPGLTDMLAGLLTEGTESLTSREIADEVARMGATVSAGANSDYTSVAASSLSRFSDNILELMADVTLRPSFPEGEVELTKQNTKESLRQQRAQPSFLASEMVARVMFGDHPYSVIAPTPESIDETSRDQIVQFHASKFLPNNAVFIVAGDFSTDSLLKKIESLFGEWEPGKIPGEDFPSPPVRTSRSAYVVDRAGSAQSNIVIANSGITRTSPDYFPALLMHTVLGANASSRLFMNLREEKGYTYGAYSNLDARRAAGSFRVSAEVRTQVTGDSLKEFFYELNRIRTDPVTKKEISDAKSYLTGVFPIRLETQEGLIDQFVQMRMFGLPDDYLETYRDRVQAVTIAEIQEVASRYIRPDLAAIVVVGDGRQIIEQMEPYTEEVEFYNTAGKLKTKPTDSVYSIARASLVGTWLLDIQTPLGQTIPANLIITEGEEGLDGRVESEIGEASLASAVLEGQSFSATMSFNMDGNTVEAQISGDIQDHQMEGTITLQNAPPMTFTGGKSAQ